MCKKRGQASVEFLLVVGFALLMILPLTYILYEQVNDGSQEIYDSQTQLVARKIVETANQVYYLGHPSASTLAVYMPEGIDTISMNSREIVFRNRKGSEIVGIAQVNLTGNLSVSSGARKIRIAAIEYMNIVNITDE